MDQSAFEAVSAGCLLKAYSRTKTMLRSLLRLYAPSLQILVGVLCERGPIDLSLIYEQVRLSCIRELVEGGCNSNPRLTELTLWAFGTLDIEKPRQTMRQERRARVVKTSLTEGFRLALDVAFFSRRLLGLSAISQSLATSSRRWWILAQSLRSCHFSRTQPRRYLCAHI